MSNPSRFSAKTAIRMVVLVNIGLALAGMWVGNWTMATIQILCAFALFGLSVLVGTLDAPPASAASSTETAQPPQRSRPRHLPPPPVPDDFHPGYGNLQVQMEVEDEAAVPPLIEWVIAQSGVSGAIDVQAARDLVAAGADPAATDEEGDNAYTIAALADAAPAVLDVLVELGVDPLAESELLERMLEFEPDPATLRTVLSHGANPSAEPSDYVSLLELAIAQGCSDEVVMCLVDAGADITATTLEDESLLAYAADNDYALSTQLALIPSWETPPTGKPVLPANWPLDDALVHATKQDEAASLVGPLILAGADPFAQAPTFDESALASLAENEDIQAILAVAHVLPQKDRYRLQGYIQALADSIDIDQLNQWIGAMDELELAWLRGHGSPKVSPTRAQGQVADLLASQLSKASGWSEVQRLLLAGADPLKAPAGGRSPLEKALRSGEYHLAAMMLECLPPDQADGFIAAQGFGVDHERVALSWWKLRQRLRARYWENLPADPRIPVFEDIPED